MSPGVASDSDMVTISLNFVVVLTIIFEIEVDMFMLTYNWKIVNPLTLETFVCEDEALKTIKAKIY